MTDVRPGLRRYARAIGPEGELAPLGGGASARRFWRLRTADAGTRVIMDYGGPFRGETDDMRIGRIFRRAGLRAARILDSSPETGCLLLEDLGDRSLAAALDAAGAGTDEARSLLERAVALAARVADRGTPELARSDRRDGPALDSDRFRFEMDFFLEHYVGGLHCRGAEPAGLRDALYELADTAADTPRKVLCHRDFHSRNLMLPADGSLAMVDIQDARWGPDTYDLASILRDAYAEIDESWIEPLVDRYVRSLESPPAAGFRLRLAVVSAQRMIKALGTFGFQATVRHDEGYLQVVPRTLARLADQLARCAETRTLHALLRDSGLLVPPS